MLKPMLPLTNLLTLMLLSLTVLGCQTYQVHPFELGYVQPYSQNCHFKNPVTKKTRTVKQGTGKDQCDLRKMLLIPIESAASLIQDLQVNCVATQCTAIHGAVDSTLLAIDQGLRQVPF